MSVSKSKWMQSIVALAFAATAAAAHGQAEPGVTKDTILIGTSMPFSGGQAVFGVYAKGVQAYFNYVNANGGVHGRKLVLKAYDDGYDPGRTSRNARRLVETDGVFAVAFVVGTAHNLGIRQYLNDQKVPQVLANSGHREFGDPESVKKYPWTTAWLPPYELESFAISGYLRERKPAAKVAVLHTNDDLGKSLMEGFRKATQGTKMSVEAVQIYNPSDPSVAGATQVLAQSGADVFLNWSGGTFTTQSIAKMTELGWRPTTFLISWNTALTTLKPAGLENAKGFLAPGYLKTPTDPLWANDEGMKRYREIMKKHAPDVDANQQLVAYGFTEAEIFVTALRKAPELTRAALMKSLRNMKDEKMTMLVPGITVSTDASKGQHWPITALSMREFNGEAWKDTGKVYSMR